MYKRSVNWRSNKATCHLAAFLSNYWSYNFDACELCLDSLRQSLACSVDTHMLPKYSKYDMDGYMYAVTDCVQAACNEGNFYDPSSDEYKGSVGTLSKYLEEGTTSEPQTDPSKGLVPSKLSDRATHAAEALWNLSVALHRDSSLDNIRDAQLCWSRYTEEANLVVPDTRRVEDTVLALGYVLSEAAATKFEISSS